MAGKNKKVDFDIHKEVYSKVLKRKPGQPELKVKEYVYDL